MGFDLVVDINTDKDRRPSQSSRQSSGQSSGLPSMRNSIQGVNLSHPAPLRALIPTEEHSRLSVKRTPFLDPSVYGPNPIHRYFFNGVLQIPPSMQRLQHSQSVYNPPGLSPNATRKPSLALSVDKGKEFSEATRLDMASMPTSSPVTVMRKQSITPVNRDIPSSPVTTQRKQFIALSPSQNRDLFGAISPGSRATPRASPSQLMRKLFPVVAVDYTPSANTVTIPESSEEVEVDSKQQSVLRPLTLTPPKPELIEESESESNSPLECDLLALFEESSASPKESAVTVTIKDAAVEFLKLVDFSLYADDSESSGKNTFSSSRSQTSVATTTVAMESLGLVIGMYMAYLPVLYLHRVNESQLRDIFWTYQEKVLPNSKTNLLPRTTTADSHSRSRGNVFNSSFKAETKTNT
eukprot:gene45404-56555_t